MEQNHLTTEIITFFQSIFQNIDEFEKELTKLKNYDDMNDMTELLAFLHGFQCKYNCVWQLESQ